MGIARNYLYNTLLTLTNLLVPFITIPYISRVLDPEGIGAVSFTASVVQYFVLFATLGTDLYGTREVASVRKNNEKLSDTFWQIEYLRATATLLAYVAFSLSLLFSYPGYRLLYLINSLLIINTALDITFLFRGLEDFAKITVRGLLVRLLGTCLIFLLIHKPSDYPLYALINVITTILGSVVMWLYFRRYNLHPTKFSLEQIKLHFIGSIKLFVPMLAIEVYTVLDKTMVGILSTEAEVGYYTMSQRLVKMVLALITSLGTVVMPRMSNLVATDQHKEIEKYIRMIFDFLTYGSILAMVLILVTIKDFVPLFFGSKFLKVSDLVIYITPIILFISWSNLFGIQIMVPMKRENYLTASVIAGALVNFTMNLLLIPSYQALGAVIGTVIAEFTVTLVQMILVRKLISLKPLFAQTWKHFVAGSATFLALILLPQIGASSLARIILKGILAVSIYVAVEGLLRSSTNSLVIRKILSAFRARM